MKKMFFVIAFISLIVSIALIQETYAKYLTDASGITDILIARWKIKINDQDILTDSSITNVITPTFTPNEHIEEGVIAPGSEGYFDIVMDVSQVDVSFKYEVLTATNVNSSITDLNVVSYSINGETPIPVVGNINDLSNVINHTSNVDVINLRVYIAWNDDATATMDNSADTMASLSGESAKMDVSIKFTQIIE